MNIPEVEIEIRLGSINNFGIQQNKTFDSSLDKTYFEKILSNLESYKEWKNIYITNTVEYIQNIEYTKKLKSIHYDDNVIVNILKESIFKKDLILQNMPFDIRFSVNQELKTKKELNKELNTAIRQKQRKSFVDSCFIYDLTHVIETINNVSKEKFEIEIELIINNETLEWSDQYLNDFLLCKVQDIINLLNEKDTVLPPNISIIE
jgi:hypothetical protein